MDAVGLAQEELLQELPTAVDLLLPHKSRLKCFSCLRTGMVSWQCPSIPFLVKDRN